MTRLALLGGAALATPSGAAIPRLEKKTAGVLAFLALEGTQSRSRCAGLLWPETPERAARNNLVQTLRRLHRDAKATLVAGDDALHLEGVEVDVAELELAVLRRAYAEVTRLGGELLAGYDYDECPDFADWLAWRRRTVRTTLRRGLEEECERLASARDYPGAIALAETIVARDPESELGHRRLVRLHHERGDDAAALAALRRYERKLKQLELRPSAEVLALRALVKRARRGKPVRSHVDDDLPLRLARPPYVARRKLAEQAERALAGGGAVLLFGERGAGKTRTMLELLSARGAYELVEGREGDRGVVYATIARALEQLVARRRPELPDWVRAELSRLAPGGKSDAPVDDLVLFEAFAQVVAACAAKGMQGLAIDDVHLADDASLGAIEQLLRRPRASLAVVAASRGPDVLEGAPLVRIEVPPMTEAEVRALAAAVRPGRALGGSKIDDIGRACGRNPRLVLESIEAAVLGREASAEPEQVRALLEHRIGLLSPAAVRLARVAAIAGAEIDADLAARVLEVHAVDLVDAWNELGRAQLWDGDVARFAHEGIAETLRDGMPRPIQAHLHASVARVLEARGADPTRIARHWSAAGRGELAAPYLVAASERAFVLSRQADAIRLAEEAAALYEQTGDLARAHALLVDAGRRVRHVDPIVAMKRILASLERLERTDRERAGTLLVRAWYEEGDPPAEETARLALEAGRRTKDPIVEAEALQILFLCRNRRADLDGAAKALAEFRAAAARIGDNELILPGIVHEGELAAMSGRHADAAAAFVDVHARIAAWGQHRNHLASMLGLAALSEIARGRGHEAAALLARAQVQVDELATLGLVPHPRFLIPRAVVDFLLGEPEAALERLRGLLAIEKRPTWRTLMRVFVVRFATRLGRDAEAERVLAAQLADASAPLRDRASAIVARADPGGGARPLPSAAHVRLVEAHGSTADQLALRLLRARRDRSQAEAERALRDAEAADLAGHALLARVVLGELAAPKEARAIAARCVEALGSVAGLEVDPARIRALADAAKVR